MDDADLVRRARSGDRQAWGLLYARYNGRVVASVIRLGVPAERALEYAQEAWTRIMARCQEGRVPDLRVPGLVITTAQNLARDGWRRDRHETPTEPDDTAADARPQVIDVLSDRQRLAKAGAVVDAMPSRAQEIFQAWYANLDAPHDSIARQVGISTQHLRDTLLRVRKAIATALREAP